MKILQNWKLEVESLNCALYYIIYIIQGVFELIDKTLNGDITRVDNIKTLGMHARNSNSEALYGAFVLWRTFFFFFHSIPNKRLLKLTLKFQNTKHLLSFQWLNKTDF